MPVIYTSNSSVSPYIGATIRTDAYFKPVQYVPVYKWSSYDFDSENSSAIIQFHEYGYGNWFYGEMKKVVDRDTKIMDVE